MKNEKEPNSKERLTSQADSSNLKREGDIFMDEGGKDNPRKDEPESTTPPDKGGSSEPEASQPDLGTGPKPEETPEKSPTAGDTGEAEELKLERQRIADDLVAEVKRRKEQEEAMDQEAARGLRGLGLDSDEVSTGVEKIKPTSTISEAALAAEVRNGGIPESLEDLAALIMKREGEEWRTGERALIKEGKLNKENFLDWVRGRMFALHDFNPTSEVNFFGDEGMGVKTDYRTISFYEIVFTRSFWLRKEKELVQVTGRDGNPKMENGEPVMIERVTHVRDNDYDALKDQLLMEVFLFGLMRNGDLAYRMNMFSPENMPKVLGQTFATNPLTRGKFMEFILSMPSMHKRSLGDVARPAGKEIQAKQETEFSMGEGVRRAFAAYMDIFDYDQLRQILGEDAPLFRLKYTEYNSETGKPAKEKDKTTDKEPKSITLDPTEAIDRLGWFENGRIKAVSAELIEKERQHPEDLTEEEEKLLKNRRDYLDYINIFTGPGPMMDQRRIEEVRERIVLSIMEKTGISYLEAKLAEAWAFSMTRFTGVAARNDTGAIGFDLWTKLTRTKEYRNRQRKEERGGKFGKPQSINGIKRIALTFVEGARDVHQRPIYKIIQGGEGGSIDIDRNPIKNTVDLERRGEFIVLTDARTDAPKGKRDVTEDRRIVGHREETDEKGNVVGITYKNEAGEWVKLKDVIPTYTTTGVAQPLRFNSELQRQFVPNHIQTAIGIYNSILDDVEINFPQLVTGYSRGNPLIDHDKLNKIKDGIEHDVRYALSTWPDIDYSAKIRTWEKGRGSMDMSILESMFGAEALKFIQAEIEVRGLGAKNEEDLAKRIKVKDDKGNDVEVDLCKTKDKDFKIAVWKGVFMYLIAKEIEAHRTFGSGYKYYNLMDMKKTLDLLSYNSDPKNPESNSVASKAEIKEIQKDTKTETSRLINQAIAYWLAGGSASAFLAMIRTFIKTL